MGKATGDKTEEARMGIEEWLKHNKITICPPEETTPENELVYKYKAAKESNVQRCFRCLCRTYVCW